MLENSKIENFRFWTHKVLPLVYDDSLSYYEFLCKVVAKLNEVIDSTNTTEENMEELIEVCPKNYNKDSLYIEVFW